MSEPKFHDEAQALYKLIPKPNDTSPGELNDKLKQFVEEYQVPIEEARRSVLRSQLQDNGVHSDRVPVDNPDLRRLYYSVKEDLKDSVDKPQPEPQGEYPHGGKMDDIESKAEKADTLLQKAKDDTSDIDLEPYRHLLTAEKVETRKKATQAIFLISEDDPEPVLDILDALKDALADSSEEVYTLAAGTFGNLVEVAPKVGLTEISQFETLISDGEGPAKTNAAYCLGVMAEEYQSKLHHCVETVFDNILDQEDGFQSNCVFFLTKIAETQPERLTDRSDEIQSLLATDNQDVQVGVFNILIELSQTYPEEIRPLVDDIISILEEGNENVIEGALSCLMYFAEDYPEDLQPHMDLIKTAVEDSPNVNEMFVHALLKQIKTGENPDLDAETTEADTTSDGTISDTASETDFEDTSYLAPPPSTDFTAVAGMEALKEELREHVIDPLQHSEKYDKYGISVEKGILLFGPPGTGKTHISKALAGELDINWAKVKGGDIISKWVGEGTENITELFEEARTHQPCLIFIDEIDALSPERNSLNQTHNQMAMVNTLLEEISELNDQEDDVIVVGATNREDQLDPAMLRSGRLSQKIEVPPPDASTRRQIFDHHLDAPRAVDLCLESVGDETIGLTAADMEQVATNAARNALEREGRVTLADVRTAIDSVASSNRSVSSYVSTPPALDFSEVAGMDRVKTKLYDHIIDPLQNPAENEKYGLSVSNGVLLYGPAGTGKTYMSKALAGELGINFANISVTDLLSKWAGEGPDNIETVFKEARQYAPCLVFIDEIDALTPQRGGSSQTQSQTNMVNTFLEEMTAIEESNDDVVVIGATNRIDNIDTAMLRSGRLSTKINVSVPDASTRCEILDYHLTAPRAGELKLECLQAETDGFTAADMKAVATKAARSAKDHGRAVTSEDLRSAAEDLATTGLEQHAAVSRGNPNCGPIADSHLEPQYQ